MEAIKVKETRTHKYFQSYGECTRGSRLVDTLVTDAQLVFVECRPEEAVLYEREDSALFLVNSSFGNIVKGTGKYLNPILISLTAKIEVGDWMYNHYSTIIRRRCEDFDILTSSETWSKVLALPEHFSPQQLQDIVSGKLKDGDKVVVECEDNMYLHEGSGKYWEDEPVMRKKYLDRPEKYIKLNSSSHITLHKVEEKMVPVSLLEKVYNEGYANGANRKSIDFKEWFEQNVK